MSTIVEGIEPVMLFAPITRLVMLWKYPISDGRDPVSCIEFSSIFSTLAKSEVPDTFPHVTP